MDNYGMSDKKKNELYILFPHNNMISYFISY